MLRNATNFIRNTYTRVTLLKNSYSTSSTSCWSCSRELTGQEAKAFFCPCKSKVILPVNQENNYFDLFDLKVNYEIEKKDLVKKFRTYMRKLHPDLFTLKSEAEKEYSSNYSSLMNKAFTTLSNPIDRGLYLLKLNQIDYKMESNIQSKQEDADKQKILVDILELNELIDEITETRQVEELEAKLNEIILPFEKQLKASFERNDFENAVEILSKMKYYQNVTERLEDLKLKFDIKNF